MAATHTGILLPQNKLHEQHVNTLTKDKDRHTLSHTPGAAPPPCVTP